MAGAAVPWSSTHLDRGESSIEAAAADGIGLYASPPVSHLELAARLPGYTSRQRPLRE